MKLFAHSRCKRNTAFVVLMVWLFALASGIANACLLETPERHFKAEQGSAATTGQALSPLVIDLDASAAHSRDHDSDHHPDNTKESCLKACDDATRTVAKANSGIDDTGPGPAPWVATLWTGAPQIVSVTRRLNVLAIPIVGPPFRVRYSRLAL